MTDARSAFAASLPDRSGAAEIPGARAAANALATHADMGFLTLLCCLPLIDRAELPHLTGVAAVATRASLAGASPTRDTREMTATAHCRYGIDAAGHGGGLLRRKNPYSATEKKQAQNRFKTREFRDKGVYLQLASELLECSCNWVPIRNGESGDFVYRRNDDLAYAKISPLARVADLVGERERLTWLHGRGVACPEIIDWRETEEGACLVMTAIPGVPAVDLSGADLLKAWPSMTQQLGVLHSLPVIQCPFERSLSRMFAGAVDVVSRNAVNPDFLPDEDKNIPQQELLARVEQELTVRLDQESADMVVCHGDPCMPNFIVDPQNLRCSGVIDLGRLGTADRYADLALLVANAGENWTSLHEAERAFAILFDILGINAPDRERLAFYLRLDPLTWG